MPQCRRPAPRCRAPPAWLSEARRSPPSPSPSSLLPSRNFRIGATNFAFPSFTISATGSSTPPSFGSSPSESKPRTSTAVSPSTSSTTESSRGASSRPCRPFLHPRRPHLTELLPAISVSLGPRRPRIRAAGEPLVLRDLSSLPLSLCTMPSPCTAARRRNHGRRRNSGDQMVCPAAPPGSSPPPIAIRALSRDQFRAKSTNR